MAVSVALQTAGRRSARVLLVGFEDQDNLGLRYLSSTLKAHGHETRFVVFGNGAAPVIEAARQMEPHIVGFSLIFQFMVPEFRDVIAELRAAGISAHITIGGHYASFEPRELLEAIPDLDSVVRFEGEDTLLELATKIIQEEDWRLIDGIAYRDQQGNAVLNPARQGRADLDQYPWPDRDDIPYELQDFPTASILASRGCPWQCSFCSIITFYEGNGTKGRRRRDPMKIVDEMEYLHLERDAEILLWQDDDFLAGGPAAVRWAHAIAAETIRRGLHRSLRWKLSCRSDETKRASLEPLVEAGLTHVYLGVEAGDAEDLKSLNKLLKPDVHITAGNVLRDLGLSFDFGFMLLQPWSTIDSVRNNIRFLREFVGDGAAPATFCRMLPYVGTAAEARLREEGRLFENNLRADYNFLDPRLDVYYAWLIDTFTSRNFTQRGTLNLLRLLTFVSHVDLPERPRRPSLQSSVQCITSVNNSLVFDVLETALEYVELESDPAPTDPFLMGLKELHEIHDARSREDIAAILHRLPKPSRDHACV